MIKPNISQTLIKQFEDAFHCPKRINALYVAKTHQQEDSLSKLKGSYFETHVLGSMGNGSEVKDLPRKRNGEPTIDQARIDLQIEAFPKVLEEYGIKMPKEKARQLSVTKEYNGYTIKGIFDFVTEINSDEYGTYPIAVFDLKLTKDRDNEFGDFCWGVPENMDHIQAHMYTWLFLDYYKAHLPEGYVPGFYYLLFDYKPAFGHKLVKVEYDAYYEGQLLERIDHCISKVEEAIKEEWPASPSPEMCKNCPLYKDKSCTDALTANEIIGDCSIDDVW